MASPPSQEPPSPFKGEGGSKTGIVVAVAIVVLLVGGLYFYTQDRSDSVFPALTSDQVGYDDAEAVSRFTDDPSVMPGYMTYTDLVHGFRIDYPKDWTMQNDSSVVHVIFSTGFTGEDDVFTENINLTTEDVSWYGPLTLEEYGDAAYEQLMQALPEYVLLERKSLLLGDYNGESLLGEYEIEGLMLHVLSLYIIEDSMVYVLTYTYDASDTRYQDEVDYMIGTFDLL